jgi:hypothetical protein
VATETVFSSIRHGYHLDQVKEMAAILDLMKQERIHAPLSPVGMIQAVIRAYAMLKAGVLIW